MSRRQQSKRARFAHSARLWRQWSYRRVSSSLWAARWLAERERIRQYERIGDALWRDFLQRAAEAGAL